MQVLPELSIANAGPQASMQDCMMYVNRISEFIRACFDQRIDLRPDSEDAMNKVKQNLVNALNKLQSDTTKMKDVEIQFENKFGELESTLNKEIDSLQKALDRPENNAEKMEMFQSSLNDLRSMHASILSTLPFSLPHPSPMLTSAYVEQTTKGSNESELQQGFKVCEKFAQELKAMVEDFKPDTADSSSFQALCTNASKGLDYVSSIQADLDAAFQLLVARVCLISLQMKETWEVVEKEAIGYEKDSDKSLQRMDALKNLIDSINVIGYTM